MVAFENPAATGVLTAGALDGTERIQLYPGSGGSNNAPNNVFTTAQQIADLASVTSDNEVITSINTVGAGVLTAAAIVGGIISRGGAQSAAAFSDATDTAVAIIAALPAGAPVGTSFTLTIGNTTDGAETITGGVGVTISGTAVIPKLTWHQYLVKVTAAATVSITHVASGQINAVPLSKLGTSDGVATLSVTLVTGAQLCAITITGTVAPVTVYLPPATEIVAALPTPSVGMNYLINMANLRTTTGIVTVSAGSGVTVAGLATMTGVNTYAQFNVSIDSATAVTVTRVGS